MKVKWTDLALRHLSQIHDFIAQDSPRYALAMVDKITRRSKQCGQFPLMAGKTTAFWQDQQNKTCDCSGR